MGRDYFNVEGGNRFRCTLCPKLFKAEGYVLRHIRAMHPLRFLSDGYGVNVFYGTKRHGEERVPYLPLDEMGKVAANDTITMCLNMMDGILSYFVNEQYMGVAFEDIDTKEKFRLTLANSVDTEFQLLY